MVVIATTTLGLIGYFGGKAAADAYSLTYENSERIDKNSARIDSDGEKVNAIDKKTDHIADRVDKIYELLVRQSQ